MKFLAVFVIACIALAAAQGPTKISSNNVGDIVNVDVNANAKISNTVDATIINVLLRYLNSQRIQLGGGGGGGDNGPSWPGLPDLPEFPGLPGLPNPPNLPPNLPPNFPPQWPPQWPVPQHRN